jgi:hypothetical protein
LDNIQRLKRKEKSTYTPADIWTAEDDLLFLKYCPSKRTKCYHAMSHDTGCRPHELLKLKIKDIAFKTSGDKQYAEISINGKTGSRHIPLIDSIPYVKDYLDHEHPQPGNPKKNLPTAAFDAMFDMVRLNGSAMHKHEIHNFTLTSISMPNNKTVVFNGTVTITMKNGPVNGVPVSVRAMDANVISIWIDPTKTDNHFGNTPIYGTITKAVQIMK